MELSKAIYHFYEEIGKQIDLTIPGKLKYICESQIDQQTGCFTVTLEILVINRILDRDNGVVFSTNAQQSSHFKFNKMYFVEGLYLISDLSYGDGEIIDSITEQSYFFAKNSNNEEIFNIVESFTHSKIRSIRKILFDRYGVS